MIGECQQWGLERVRSETGLCRTDIYRRMRARDATLNPFPRNHRFRSGGKARFWRSDEVNAWKLRECGPRADDAGTLYELGLAFSSGGGDIAIDLIEAHKWFNLAARHGSDDARERRAEVAAGMSAHEIAEAQRRARAWLVRRAASPSAGPTQ